MQQLDALSMTLALIVEYQQDLINERTRDRRSLIRLMRNQIDRLD